MQYWLIGTNMELILRAKSWALALLAGLSIGLSEAAQAQAGRSIFCCDDAAGRPVCGDVLPSACFGRAYREISPQGAVRRYVEAPLSREELARRAEAERREREEEARRKVQERLDQALFETYPNLEAIDEREERALAEVERASETLRQRMKELADERQRLDAEAEFYVGREMPRELENAFRSLASEEASFNGLIEAREAEKAAIKERYAADRRRYAELLASGFKRR